MRNRDSAARHALVLVFVVAALALAAAFTGCHPGIRKRAYGNLRLGKVAEFPEAEYFLPDLSLLLRRDAGGFYVMSTTCTYDESDLVPVKHGDSFIFKSSYTTSSYTAEGKVLSGPARGDLPYFQIELAPGDDEVSPDTLYVNVGREVSSAWRLAVPHSRSTADGDGRR